ncbi:MAG TPA: BTAD domain-containing putative transcriptional regulator, partial [Acidimicrobiia bacterium]|nr:BTAD domain-containing putative transcriptional regulator [Acidimicrobiia bacterium]
GPLTVMDGDHEMGSGSPMDRALLILLLLHRGSTIGLDQIIDALWGEQPPASARHSIHTMVWRLRRVLGNEEIVNTGPGYKMRKPLVDVDELAALVAEGRARLPLDPDMAADLFGEALTLWRGEPLLDVGYTDWAQPEIRRLEELRSSAVVDRLTALVSMDRCTEAIPELEAFVTASPHQERAWGLLIVALTRAGRSADALRCFRRAERLLVEELGLAPSKDLRNLEYLILSQDPDLEGRWIERFVHGRLLPIGGPLDE